MIEVGADRVQANGWNDEVTKEHIETGRLTPFEKPSAHKTQLKNIECGLCYGYFHMMNKLACCNGNICTQCLRTAINVDYTSYCPLCRQQVGSVNANQKNHEVDTEELLEQNRGERKQYLLEIIKKYKIVENLQREHSDWNVDMDFIESILQSEVIDDLVSDDL